VSERSKTHVGNLEGAESPRTETTSKSENKSSLLAPVIGVYEPTDADADRIFAKVEAALDAESGPSSSRAASTTPSSLMGRGTLFGLTFVAVAVVATMAFRAAPDASRPALPTAPATHGAPLADATAEPSLEPKVEAPDAVSVPSVAVNTLPNAVPAATTIPSANAKKVAANAPTLQQAPPNASDTLEKEARVLADARSASGNHDEARALALLDEHASMFPNGWLANEREAERILVLCRMGRQAEAARAGAAFLQGRPKSPLTQRVEMSCAVSPGEKAAE
jgi:hypothetical protein